MNAPLDFPAFIRYHRVERKLSQQGLADLAAIPKTVIQGIERDGCIPGLPVLLSLAEALDPDPSMGETLRHAGYHHTPTSSAMLLWRGLDKPTRLALQRLAEVPSGKRTRCLHLVASLVTAWLEAEGLQT